MVASGAGRRGRRPLNRAGPMPLWAQLRDDLVGRVAAGEFPAEFPGELQIADEYGVSRHTVREAVRHLREDGLVAAARGRASVVTRTTIETPLGSLYSLFKVVEAQGMNQRSDVLAQEVVSDATLAARLDLAPDAELFHLARLRFADGEPLACDRVWLPAAVARPLLGADFTHVALYDELAARCDVRLDGGTERITAVRPSARIRALLSLPRDVACLSIERTGLLHGNPFEFRITDIRGDRYAVTTEWSSRGYRVGAQPQETARS